MKWIYRASFALAAVGLAGLVFAWLAFTAILFSGKSMATDPIHWALFAGITLVLAGLAFMLRQSARAASRGAMRTAYLFLLPLAFFGIVVLAVTTGAPALQWAVDILLPPEY